MMAPAVPDGSQPEHFASLGRLAGAGRQAVQLAVDKASRSAERGRVPIAGALVVQPPGGNLQVVAVGCNGRIPELEDTDGEVAGMGYPTDHGETAAVRRIADFDGVNWANAVFATTLSPCIMCTRTIQLMHAAGLRGLVIAESVSFRGPEVILDSLEGMVVVRLAQPAIAKRMQVFSRRYPWDWAADIGEVPPRADQVAAVLERANQEGHAWLSRRASGEAAVVDARGRDLAVASDGRVDSGGNPCRDAVISAMGAAGSSVNLRECAVVWNSDLELGMSSLGACELFRPAALVSLRPLDGRSWSTLRAAGVVLVEPVSQAGAEQRTRSTAPRSRSRSRSAVGRGGGR